MFLFIILGVIVALTFAVVGVLFFLLGRETQKEEEEVPITSLDELKKELATKVFVQNEVKVVGKDSEVLPVFTPQVTLPTQPVKVSPEDEKYKKRAQELEEQLMTISKTADSQSSQAQQMIENLTKENEALKAKQLETVQAQKKLDAMETETSGLKVENASLQNQLDATSTKVRLLEEEMTAFKLQMAQEVSRANSTVAELTREKEEMLAASKPAEPDQGLKDEVAALRQKCFQLEEAQQKLRELNDSLTQKNEALGYELIKARAQSSGLERVSFNYKNQLEDFLKKVHAAQATNDQLAQVKNRLENRLVSLEREYEDFKARSQKDIS